LYQEKLRFFEIILATFFFSSFSRQNAMLPDARDPNFRSQTEDISIPGFSAGPPVFCLISRSSSFDWHTQQITFSQQNFKRVEDFLTTVLTILTSLCWVW